MQIEITRFVDEPIIKPYHNEEIGFNVQGPSLIKVPTWVEKPLGKYYLYFADHKGDSIELKWLFQTVYPDHGKFIKEEC